MYPSQDEIFHFDVFFWTCTALTTIIGVPFGLGIVQHEWYGGDTQKRSLGNRFVSWVLITNMLSFATAHTFVGLVR